MKKGSSKMKKPSRIKSFSTKTTLEKAMKNIIQFAQNTGYKVDDFNETDAIIVLSDSTSLTNYGHIYPVYLTNHSDNSITIEVGIKGKANQLMRLDAPHERCFNGIKTAIYAASVIPEIPYALDPKSGSVTNSRNTSYQSENSMTNQGNNTVQPSTNKTKFCTECGKSVSMNDSFCISCGFPFQKPSETPIS